jgi:DNA primase
VVLTEGPVDAIMLRQYDIPAVSQTTGSGYWNKAWNKYFAHLKAIWVVYDNDKAGKEHATKRAEAWGMRAKIYTFDDYPDGFDVTDFFKKHKDDSPRELFLAKLETEAKYYFEMEEWCDL